MSQFIFTDNVTANVGIVTPVTSSTITGPITATSLSATDGFIKGNLSIGAPLDTVNTMRLFISDGTIKSAFGYKAGGVEYLGNLTNHPLAFLTNNTERLRIDSSGNVGIGTTSPVKKLHISGSNELFRLSGTTPYGISTDGTVSAFIGGISDGDIGAFSGTLSNHHYAIRTNNAERLRIDSSGNVGIGTNSPTFGSGSGVELSRSGVATFRATSGGQGVEFRNNAGSAEIDTRGAYPIILSTDQTERLRIDSSGNVGIGKTSEGAKLDVRTSVNDWTGGFTSNVASGNMYGLFSYFSGRTPNDTNSIFFYAGDPTNTKCYIYSTGTVANRTGSYVSFSDIKLKQDIVDAGNQWNDIKELRVRKFRLKDEVLQNPNQPFFIGLIAQEVEGICPSLVETVADFHRVESVDQNGNKTTKLEPTGTSTKTVKYSILYMKAVKALQEAMLRIEALESKVAALEGK